VGGALCVIGTAALAMALPRFLRYDGKNGMARKRAEDEAFDGHGSVLQVRTVRRQTQGVRSAHGS